MKKKTTILLDVLAIAFFKNTFLHINVFHNLTYSISTAFYKVYEHIKISQTERD